MTDCLTWAEAAGDGWVLSGEKVVVFNGANCNQMVVLARTAGDQWERDGLSLFVVAADAEGSIGLTTP